MGVWLKRRLTTGIAALGLMLLLLLPTFAGAAPAASSTTPKVRPPVVVMVLDEIPTSALIDHGGNIWRSRFPNLARLSREATWYPNYSTNSGTTYLSVPTILSGKYSRSGNTFPIFRQYEQNLFSWMNGSGYRIRAEEVATRVCPPGVCPAAPGSTPDPAKFASAREYMFASVQAAPNVYRRDALALVKALRIRPGELIFRHLLLPHHPYKFLPSCREYTSGPVPLSGPVQPDGAGRPRVSVPSGNVRLGYERMMLQLGCTDRVIGALRRTAIRQGMWKSMMLVVVGDHGVDHRPGGFRRDATPDTIGSIGFTPLFIKYPGSLRGGKSPLPVRGIDLFPTITEATGSAMPDVDGTPISRLGAESAGLRVDGVTYPFSQAVASRDRALRFRNRVLGKGGLFRMGPAPLLIGRKSTTPGLVRTPARLDSPRWYSGANGNAGKASAMVTGTVKRLPPGRIVAVSVNGRIRGTAQIFRDGKAKRFGAMIDPRHLRRTNRISVFAVW